MTLSGTVMQGTIVLDDPQRLPEGARVQVVVESTENQPGSLQEALLKHAGCLTDLPDDFAQQHDHYIHGTPKR